MSGWPRLSSRRGGGKGKRGLQTGPELNVGGVRNGRGRYFDTYQATSRLRRGSGCLRRAISELALKSCGKATQKGLLLLFLGRLFFSFFSLFFFFLKLFLNLNDFTRNGHLPRRPSIRTNRTALLLSCTQGATSPMGLLKATSTRSFHFNAALTL
jgi:hypothetical protein